MRGRERNRALSERLKSELQPQLNQAGIVDRAAHDTESVTTEACIRRAELGAIEEIEEFAAKFDTHFLVWTKGSSLKRREVPVLDGVLLQEGIYTSFVAEPVCRGRREASGVNPFADSGSMAAGHAGIAVWNHVRSKSASA